MLRSESASSFLIMAGHWQCLDATELLLRSHCDLVMMIALHLASLSSMPEMFAMNRLVAGRVHKSLDCTGGTAVGEQVPAKGSEMWTSLDSRVRKQAGYSPSQLVLFRIVRATLRARYLVPELSKPRIRMHLQTPDIPLCRALRARRI